MDRVWGPKPPVQERAANTFHLVANQINRIGVLAAFPSLRATQSRGWWGGPGRVGGGRVNPSLVTPLSGPASC